MSKPVTQFNAALVIATLANVDSMFRKKQKDMVNPGNYRRIAAECAKLSRNPNGFTRDQIVAFTTDLKDKAGKPLSEAAVQASVNVILSPRFEAREGCDCRGNMSAPGHLYGMDTAWVAVKRFGKEVKGKDGQPETEKRFKMCMREKALDPLKRTPVKKVEGEGEKPAGKGKGKDAAPAAPADAANA